jgi:hypothetical protein
MRLHVCVMAALALLCLSYIAFGIVSNLNAPERPSGKQAVNPARVSETPFSGEKL